MFVRREFIFGAGFAVLALLLCTVYALPVETGPAKRLAGEKSPFNWVTCTACKALVITLQDLVRRNSTEEDIIKIAKAICIDFKIEDERVCTGVTREYKDIVVGVLSDVFLDPDEFCGYFLGNSCAHAHNPFDESWTVPLLDTPKPPYRPPPAPSPGKPVTKVLHLSDIHFDSKYAPGSLAKCNEPLCCRAWLGPGHAGDYGSFNCDSPLLLLENLLRHIQAHVPVDYVIFTGDVPAHNIWNQSREDIVDAITAVSSLLSKYLPKVKVYPAMGNHESAPVNSFPPPYVTGHNSHKWLLDAVAKSWSTWLPPSTIPTIEKGGYYVVEAEKGLRIISLNMNYCNPLNWWLLINDTDPAGELVWLRDQLQAAENAGDKVHIIGHIPPGGGCLKAWSWAYHKIVDRYADTVRGQFYGHTHSDEVVVFFDEKNRSLPVGTIYIGPSVTPYRGGGGLYPAYRIYEKDGVYDATTHSILDHSTYILNLTRVDVTKMPVWQFEYSARDAYGMSGLHPRDWADLVRRMETDNSLVQKYYRYRGHSAGHGTCDADCTKNIICGMKSSRADDPSQCEGLTELEYKRFRAWVSSSQTC